MSSTGNAGSGLFCLGFTRAWAQLPCGACSWVVGWNSITGLNSSGLYAVVWSCGSGKSNRRLAQLVALLVVSLLDGHVIAPV